MNKETQSIIRNLQTVTDGEPWYGQSVLAILEEIDPAHTHISPGNKGHSLAELLYHMLTWMEFTLKRLEDSKEMDPEMTDKLDWRTINPRVHTWEKGMASFRSVSKKIIELLGEKDDSFLSKKVTYRTYDFRFLLNGLIQHNIYHLGQIAYINKYLL